MNSIEANTRNTKTKGELNSIRDNGEVPAIIYGGKEENQKISVSKKNLERIFVIESHLIFESEIKNFMNEIWTIESSEQLQMERLVDYRGLSLDYAKQIISVQNDSLFRKKKSDKVIENTNELFMFRNKIIKLINKLENKLNSE